MRKVTPFLCWASPHSYYLSKRLTCNLGSHSFWIAASLIFGLIGKAFVRKLWDSNPLINGLKRWNKASWARGALL